MTRASYNAGPDGIEAPDFAPSDDCTVCGEPSGVLTPLDGEDVCDECLERDTVATPEPFLLAA
ncbi:MAG: hypothetical protein Rubg2KO_15280 [Rubricoccaceae bacterium]